MLESKEKGQKVGRASPLTWVALALFGVGGLIEGAVTGTAYAQRFPYAALGAWCLVLVGSGLMLLGYHRQLTRTGLPPNPAFFLWATLAIVAYTVGWANLRGVIRDLDESFRDWLVAVGLPVGLLGLVWAVVSLMRWRRGLNPEQRALHWQTIRPWVIALVAVALVAWVGGVLFHLLVSERP